MPSALERAQMISRLAVSLPPAMVGRSTADALLDQCASVHGDRVAIAYLDERITYRQLRERSDQYARFFASQGIGAGDRVALDIDNRPDLLFAFHGLQRLGAIAALINTNLTGTPLAHVVRAAEPKLVVIGSEHAAAIGGLLTEMPELGADQLLVQQDPDAAVADVDLPAGVRSLNADIDLQPTGPMRPARAKARHHCAYIYTSGTTGLPKAAIVSHQRFASSGVLAGHGMHRCGPGEMIYVALPLYHSSALIMGWGGALSTGAGMALRRRFSASAFFDDVRRFDARSALYIGELCRYLLRTPEQQGERDHRLRVVVGNGMRPDVWQPFQARFAIPLVREFYGATEGTGALVNLAGRPGMVGRLPPGYAIVRCDPATGEVRRNRVGLCQRVRPGEAGLFVSPITPAAPFEGYRDRAASDAKVLRNVFLPGDRYFDSGDLLRLHQGRWVSFVDRLGDTFRWKGENVSTTEVADLLNRAPGVAESSVYGVAIPGHDGRAGMAEIAVLDDFVPDDVACFVVAELPPYERPLFLRVKPQGIDITGTFKHQKTSARDEGFDPADIEDRLYYLAGDRYLPLDDRTFAAIQAGDLLPG